MSSSDSVDPIQMWRESAEAWISGQGERGDLSRREVLDPALENLLADVGGLSILDLGCGEGRYCRHLASRGAKVVGLDPVPEFIDHSLRLDPSGEYLVASATSIPLPSQSFDLVLSYLSLLDIEDYKTACAEMIRVTKPGGQIAIVMISNMASTTDTWVRDASGRKLYRTVDNYMSEFELHLSWGGINIKNYHRPLSAILAQFLGHGCMLTDFLEPLPAEDSPMYADEFRVPTFQIYQFGKLGSP